MPEVRCRGLEIHYEEHGTGPPMVWIPGTGLRGSTWELQVSRFQERFRCLTVNLRGSGDTSGADTQFTVADLAQDIAAWLDTIGVTNAAVVSGLSFWVRRSRKNLPWPGPTWSAVWSCWLPGPRRSRNVISAGISSSRLYAIENGPLDVYAQFGFWMSSPSLFDHEPQRQAEVERLLAAHMSASPAGTAGHFRADLSHETRDRLSLINCPTLVVHGEEDLDHAALVQPHGRRPDPERLVFDDPPGRSSGVAGETRRTERAHRGVPWLNSRPPRADACVADPITRNFYAPAY